MRRTTIALPDDLAELVEREARRRHMSVSEVVRTAISSHFKLDQTRTLPFAAIFDSRVAMEPRPLEEVLKDEFANWIYRDSFNRDP